MRKHRLKVEELSVDSFELAASGAAEMASIHSWYGEHTCTCRISCLVLCQPDETPP